MHIAKPKTVLPRAVIGELGYRGSETLSLTAIAHRCKNIPSVPAVVFEQQYGEVIFWTAGSAFAHRK